MNKKSNHKENTKKRSRFLPVIVSGVSLILLVVVLITRPRQGNEIEKSFAFIFPPIELNQPAPELTLSDLDGNQISLNDFSGEVILVNNWATWCPPCRQEMPEFQAFFDEYQDHGFQIVAIEAGQPENEVRAFVDQLGLSFVILWDPENKSLTSFQQSSLPNSFVIDREGDLRFAWVGAINKDTLEQYITPLLEE
jgi:peroxiredoxin